MYAEFRSAASQQTPVTTTLTVPSQTVAVGDLLIFVVGYAADGAGTANILTPTGYTSYTNLFGSGGAVIRFYTKIATSVNDGAPLTVELSSSTVTRPFCFRLAYGGLRTTGGSYVLLNGTGLRSSDNGPDYGAQVQSYPLASQYQTAVYFVTGVDTPVFSGDIVATTRLSVNGLGVFDMQPGRDQTSFRAQVKATGGTNYGGLTQSGVLRLVPLDNRPREAPQWRPQKGRVWDAEYRYKGRKV